MVLKQLYDFIDVQQLIMIIIFEQTNFFTVYQIIIGFGYPFIYYKFNFIRKKFQFNGTY